MGCGGIYPLGHKGMLLNKSVKRVQMESDVEEYDTLREAFRHTEARGDFDLTPPPPYTPSHVLLS